MCVVHLNACAKKCGAVFVGRVIGRGLFLQVVQCYTGGRLSVQCNIGGRFRGQCIIVQCNIGVTVKVRCNIGGMVMMNCNIGSNIAQCNIGWRVIDGRL